LVSHDGTEQQILVIVTTVELDPQSERYKKRLVERLSAVRATTWLGRIV
jgi:hypothetical protein